MSLAPPPSFSSRSRAREGAREAGLERRGEVERKREGGRDKEEEGEKETVLAPPAGRRTEGCAGRIRHRTGHCGRKRGGERERVRERDWLGFGWGMDF